MLCGEPRRRRREEHVGRAAEHGETDDHRREAAEELRRAPPEHREHERGREEVAHVDAPGRVVVPGDRRRPVPEMLLQPDRRHGAEADDLVDLDLAAVVDRHPRAVGPAADQVVEPEREHEREPVDGEPATSRRSRRHARHREREQQAEHERHEHVARRRARPRTSAITQPATTHVDGERAELHDALRPGVAGERAHGEPRRHLHRFVRRMTPDGTSP